MIVDDIDLALQREPLAYFLAMAIADKALYGIESLEDLLKMEILVSQDELELFFKGYYPQIARRLTAKLPAARRECLKRDPHVHELE